MEVSKPALSIGPIFANPRKVTGRVTSLVAPCMVSVPVTSYRSPPFGVILVLLNVISGYLSTSKKFALRRSSSRLALPVSMLAALIVSCTLDASGLALSTTIVPS